jgi:hydrogenase expression/formation protein HypD
MRHTSEYRDAKKAIALTVAIESASDGRRMTIMEVCGTHTMAIARFGIRSIIPANIRLISGPGCPVCVTPNAYLDHAIAIGRERGVIICTFGDMMRVPGSTSSLQEEKAKGADVRIVYSTLGALEIAKNNPSKQIVFMGVGFETTAPTVAASIKMARDAKLENYSVLCAGKTIPPALSALLAQPAKIDGFLLPGHVSTIIGSSPYVEIFNSHRIACAIAGFEPVDILQAIHEITKQISSDDPHLHNSYGRAVAEAGNAKALAILEDVFEPCDAVWRGLGNLPASGLKIRQGYSKFDAANRFDVNIEPEKENPKCRCGEILTGLATPIDCPLFGTFCTPENPAGACMVSGEGACASYHKYGEYPKVTAEPS